MVLFRVQNTSFMLFLNKFDIFEKKVLNVSVDGGYYNDEAILDRYSMRY